MTIVALINRKSSAGSAVLGASAGQNVRDGSVSFDGGLYSVFHEGLGEDVDVRFVPCRGSFIDLFDGAEDPSEVPVYNIIFCVTVGSESVT